MNDNHINKMNVDRQPELPKLACDICGVFATVVCTKCPNAFGYEHEGMCEQCRMAHNNNHIIIPVESFRLQYRMQKKVILIVANVALIAIAEEREEGRKWIEAVRLLGGLPWKQFDERVLTRLIPAEELVQLSVIAIEEYMKIIDGLMALHGRPGPLGELCDLFTDRIPFNDSGKMDKVEMGVVQTSESGSVAEGAGKRQQFPSQARRSASVSTMPSAPGKVAKVQKEPPVYYKIEEYPPRVLLTEAPDTIGKSTTTRRSASVTTLSSRQSVPIGNVRKTYHTAYAKPPRVDFEGLEMTESELRSVAEELAKSKAKWSKKEAELLDYEKILINVEEEQKRQWKLIKEEKKRLGLD